MDSENETSHAFIFPNSVRIKGLNIQEKAATRIELLPNAHKELEKSQKDIDNYCAKLYGVSFGEQPGVSHKIYNEKEFQIVNKSQIAKEAAGLVDSLLSWLIGCAFGRFDLRPALVHNLIPGPPCLFDPLPISSPGMLIGPDGLFAKKDRIASEEWLCARPDSNTLPKEGSVNKQTIPDSEYPLRIEWDGILVDDPGFEGGQLHDKDIILRLSGNTGCSVEGQGDGYRGRSLRDSQSPRIAALWKPN